MINTGVGVVQRSWERALNDPKDRRKEPQTVASCSCLLFLTMDVTYVNVEAAFSLNLQQFAIQQLQIWIHHYSTFKTSMQKFTG